MVFIKTRESEIKVGGGTNVFLFLILEVPNQEVPGTNSRSLIMLTRYLEPVLEQ